ncbi:hypothetical protein MM817_00642 [Acidibacillus sp. S0AB]|uniref:Uncharacterized protein n=1 Tax=Sulfoacidibacillus ferrooxidans TaxID=2005001 RepID=A0A9X1V953_9BACL|nr:hypothetical protein [Sulfoacidibacillus ferrooxidans]
MDRQGATDEICGTLSIYVDVESTCLKNKTYEYEYSPPYIDFITLYDRSL